MSTFPEIQSFTDTSLDPPVRGFLHRPPNAEGNALVLTHGAGANCQSQLLTVVANALSGKGFTVLRCDLPFRQQRAFGPPRPGDAARDREGLKNAISLMRKLSLGRVFLGGHSYGGRQATMLCSDEPGIADGLLLLSYPLHPPRKPEQLRTKHLPELHTPSLFVHGTRDPFGSVEEMESALRLIPAKTNLLQVEGAGHDLGSKGKSLKQIIETIAVRFAEFSTLSG